MKFVVILVAALVGVQGASRSQFGLSFDSDHHHHPIPRPHYGGRRTFSRHRYPSVLHALDQPRLSTFSNLISAAGLSATLAGPGPYTIFAPDNKAFERLPPSYHRKLKRQPETLLKVLNVHIIPVKIKTDQIEDGDKATTLQGKNVTFKANKKEKSVNNAGIDDGDIEADNGVVHVVNDVIKPSADVDIMETLRKCPAFQTLVELIEEAGIEETLQAQDTDFTIFAPTNEAFEMVPSSVMEEWKANTTLLRDKLLNHVLAGSNFSPTFQDGEYITTLNGNDFLTSKNGGKLAGVNSARVTKADIPSGNGVIHAVDRVLRESEACDILED